MPPQPGVFALSGHKTRTGINVTESGDMSGFYHSQHLSSMMAGPSRSHGTPMEDPKSKKRKEVAGKLGKEINEYREDSSRYYAEAINDLNILSVQLSTRPEEVRAYQLRLYPLSLERSALLASLVLQERHALDCIQTGYEEEREKVEEEWKRGRDRIRERLLEGIEERRRRAREEKDGEGAVGDNSLDSQSRPHITRKLRNKLGGTSPPPTPLSSNTPGGGGISSISSGPITSGPFLNPHSLSVDELPSPFPLPLTSTHLSSGTGYGGTGAGTNNRRRAKGSGRETQAVGGLGKSIPFLTSCKEAEVEQDLGEIRRGNKRRRAAASSGLAGKT